MARDDLHGRAYARAFRLRRVAGKRHSAGHLYLQGHRLGPGNRSYTVAGSDSHGDQMRWGLQDLLVSIAIVILLLLAGIKATAQAVATATGPGTSIIAGGGASLFNSSYGQRDIGGALLFADIQPHWRFGVELEARYLRVQSSEEL